MTVPRDWDDEDDDGEEYADDSGDDSDDEPTVPCPYCRREIHEDAPQCPYCHEYVSGEDAPPARKPLWIIVGAGLCLLVIYFWIAP
jgi:hypothetical protein